MKTTGVRPAEFAFSICWDSRSLIAMTRSPF
jgi:hypothetical protein